MVQHKLVRRNYGWKLPVSIKYQNLHCFKKGMIHLCQSILETRQMSHLQCSALFTIPLRRISTSSYLVALKIFSSDKLDVKFSKVVFFSSFFISSASCSKWNARSTILFQINFSVEKNKETTQARYFITVHPSST